MATAILKDENQVAIATAHTAEIVDIWEDGIIVQLKITPELIGQLLQGNPDHMIISAVGPVVRNRRPLRAVK